MRLTKLKKFFKTNQRYWRLLTFLVFILCCITILKWKRNDYYLKCYLGQNNEDYSSGRLEDILLSKRKPNPGAAIFFHETTCPKLMEIQLTVRQACAIESAARANPETDVFVLFAKRNAAWNGTISKEINAILSYPNVHLRSVNLWTYSAGTPYYKWLLNGNLFQSSYVQSHVSDFLRYLTLWRWGGTYLDLDVIVMKSLENIESNFAGAESEHFIAAGVINLDANGNGHQIADMLAVNFQSNFDGADWGNNGPGVITRVLQKVCNTSQPELMTRKRCSGFKVFRQHSFYPIKWWNWHHFFEEKYLHQTLKTINKSIIAHVWNKHSSSKIINVNSNVAYTYLAKNFCPHTFESAEMYI